MIDQNKQNRFPHPSDGGDNDERSNTCRTQVYPKAKLSRSANQRLKWMNHFNKYRNARLTCRHFGISPDTFYLWKRRFSSGNSNTLEDDFKNRKPHKLRAPQKRPEQIEAIKKLRELNPQLGKTKIAKILQGIGYKISSSTVGRILNKKQTTGD
jgi:putative transposase